MRVRMIGLAGCLATLLALGSCYSERTARLIEEGTEAPTAIAEEQTQSDELGAVPYSVTEAAAVLARQPESLRNRRFQVTGHLVDIVGSGTGACEFAIIIDASRAQEYVDAKRLMSDVTRSSKERDAARASLAALPVLISHDAAHRGLSPYPYLFTGHVFDDRLPDCDGVPKDRVFVVEQRAVVIKTQP